MKTYDELITYVKSINLKEYAEKYYGFEFAKDIGQKNIMAQCKLKSHGHTDDTPSFAYRPENNDFICFGCKARGSIIDFEANMQGLELPDDFKEAVKLICEKENIPYDFDKKPKYSKEALLDMERRTKLAEQYKNNLFNNKIGEAFQYLVSRGLKEQTIADFTLGLTPPNEYKFGLSGISNRISFPIRNNEGNKVLGFSFRIINGDDKCKYINNPSDEIFQKRNILYGWAHAFKSIKETKTVYIVEGQMDMISMYQIGIKNTVAMMTNAITDEQIELVSKYVRTVIFVLDQDKAGRSGFKNRLACLLNKGLNVKVIPFLDFLGKDMNDVCIKLDWDLQELLKLFNSKIQDGVYFVLDNMFKLYDREILEMRKRILSASMNIINNITKDTEKYVMTNYVNKRLDLS